MIDFLVIIVVLGAVTVSGVWLATRAPALQRTVKRLRLENASYIAALEQIRQRALAGADADPELQVTLDIISKTALPSGTTE